ncbi:MAG: alpha/beta hydrolase [Thermodesulfobacteriota bacterium]
MKIIILILLSVVIAFVLIRGQQRMIYYPHPYGKDLFLPEQGQVVKYATSQGRQTAFYLAPAGAAKVPARLWLMCGGNAALALDWLDLLEGFPDPAAGFLLLDYPGYGDNQGRPDPTSIMESVEAALASLALHLGTDRADLDSRLMVMGHSLGAAAVLGYVGRHPVSRIVLVSPFTSLKDMAARLVGPLLAWTLLHDYDNRARLKEILSRPVVPVITIIHGSHDRVVPVDMGRELAALSSKIYYQEVARGDHNYILVTAKEEIIQAMVGSEPHETLIKE